jgi:hypothetical protein
VGQITTFPFDLIMTALKTRPTTQSVSDLLERLTDASQRKDGEQLASLMAEETGCQAVVWSNGIVGFGTFRYKAGSTTGQWMRVGFSARKGSLSISITPGLHRYSDLLQRLGSHKTGVSCLYVKSLKEVNLPILRELIGRAFHDAATAAESRSR